MKLRANRKLKNEYKRFLQHKDLCSFNEFAGLRRPGNYAKGVYLSKTETKRNMCQYQEKVIPRSLYKLSTEFCGSAKESDRIKSQAPGIFKNILIYTGVAEAKKTSRVEIASGILRKGAHEEKLRDEIFCQLIKQTSNCPKPDVELKGWQLLYCCARSFPPSGDLKPFIMSHAANQASETVPTKDDAPGLDTVTEIATNMFLLLSNNRFYKYKPRHVSDALLKEMVAHGLCVKLLPRVPWEDYTQEDAGLVEQPKKQPVVHLRRVSTLEARRVVSPPKVKKHGRSSTMMSIGSRVSVGPPPIPYSGEKKPSVVPPSRVNPALSIASLPLLLRHQNLLEFQMVVMLEALSLPRLLKKKMGSTVAPPPVPLRSEDDTIDSPNNWVSSLSSDEEQKEEKGKGERGVVNSRCYCAFESGVRLTRELIKRALISNYTLAPAPPPIAEEKAQSPPPPPNPYSALHSPPSTNLVPPPPTDDSASEDGGDRSPMAPTVPAVAAQKKQEIQPPQAPKPIAYEDDSKLLPPPPPDDDEDEESEEEDVQQKTRPPNAAAGAAVSSSSAGVATAVSGIVKPMEIKTTAPEIKKPPAGPGSSINTPPPPLMSINNLNAGTKSSAVMPTASHSLSSASLSRPQQTERKISVSSRTLSPSATSSYAGGGSMISMGNIDINDDEDEKDAEIKEQFSTDENKFLESYRGCRGTMDWGGMPGILMPPPQEQLEKQIDKKKEGEKNSNKKKEMLLKRNPAIKDASEKAEIAAGMAFELGELLKFAKSGDS
eukprot:jgi/Bigna1/71823/fgenesh1_pg.17_\